MPKNCCGTAYFPVRRGRVCPIRAPVRDLRLDIAILACGPYWRTADRSRCGSNTTATVWCCRLRAPRRAIGRPSRPGEFAARCHSRLTQSPAILTRVSEAIVGLAGVVIGLLGAFGTQLHQARTARIMNRQQLRIAIYTDAFAACPRNVGCSGVAHLRTIVSRITLAFTQRFTCVERHHRPTSAGCAP